MSTYPASASGMTKGMTYFPRMVDKIRLHLKGELPQDYRNNFGVPRSADGLCCNFLRVHHRDVIERVQEGGTDEEILKWCFKNGRALNEGDLRVWNSFTAKLGWNDFASDTLRDQKEKAGLAHRQDIQTVVHFMDVEEGRME